DALLVATCHGLAEFERAGAAAVTTPRWHVSASRSTSVAGPVRTGALVAWVHDEALEAVDRGARAWRASGRFAHAPGALHARDDGSVLALGLDHGIHPVLIDGPSGRLIAAG